jgi:DNA topoisomerase IB
MAERLRRSDPNRPGWTRRRHGRGFRYLDADGSPLAEADLERCRALAIPPAWTEVWICPWPNGHLQAVGVDSAGRKQYLYHPAWRQWRDEVKFQRVLAFGRSLPAARPIVAEHLALPGMPRERALAAGFRLLDRAGVRIGSEAYAQANGTVGVVTMRRDHVRTRGDLVRLQFPGKGGKEHDISVPDPALASAVRTLRARRSGGDELLAWRDEEGTWRDVESADLNAYVREVTGCDATAKDFRTWQGAVRALAALATADPAVAPTRAVAAAMREVSEHLGNTPAVARSAYVDPRIVEVYLTGEELPTPEQLAQEALERAPAQARSDDTRDADASDLDIEAWETLLLDLLDADE